MRKARKLLLAVVVLGASVLGSMPPEASALYQYCSSFYCNGYPTRRCTCPGTTFATYCGGWQQSCADLP